MLTGSPPQPVERGYRGIGSFLKYRLQAHWEPTSTSGDGFEGTGDFLK
jgi:hypothetical protein